jgi:hypothetical protein
MVSGMPLLLFEEREASSSALHLWPGVWLLIDRHGMLEDHLAAKPAGNRNQNDA